MEIKGASQVFQSSWQVGFAPNALILSAPSQDEAFNLAFFEPEALADWAQRFGFDATLVKYPGGQHYRVPAAMATLTMSNSTLILDPNNPLIEVYALSLSPEMYREIGWFLEHPEQAGGIVRIHDNQQVAMSYANAKKDADYTAGAGVKKAVSWKREDYWHPGDLNDFDRDWQQQLEPNNPNSWIEARWRSFDPDLGLGAEDGWIEFVNCYKLIRDERTGLTYHVSQNIGMKEIAKPVGI